MVSAKIRQAKRCEFTSRRLGSTTNPGRVVRDLDFDDLRERKERYTSQVVSIGLLYPKLKPDESGVTLKIWYKENKKDVLDFEKQMRRKVHYR